MGLKAGVWPVESAAYVVTINMWEGHAPTRRLCNSRLGAVASLYSKGMEVVCSQRTPKKGWIQSSPRELDADFISKLNSGKRKTKHARFHPGGKCLHHLTTQGWNHNAYQMNKRCCGMWKSVVFSENRHGPWRLTPQRCCLSKLPELLSYNKSMFLLPRQPSRFSTLKFMGCH